MEQYTTSRQYTGATQVGAPLLLPTSVSSSVYSSLGWDDVKHTHLVRQLHYYISDSTLHQNASPHALHHMHHHHDCRTPIVTGYWLPATSRRSWGAV
jgi:hypothetical protein